MRNNRVASESYSEFSKHLQSLIAQNEDIYRFLHGSLRKGNIRCKSILLFFLHASILFTSTTVALEQKMLMGGGFSHIATVLVDSHGAFIKGHSQPHAFVSFWCMF